MKFEARYKPEAMKYDSERWHTPYLDVEKKKIIATDGYKLLALPVTPEEADTSGYIMPESFKYARKLAGKLEEIRLTVNGGVTFPDGSTTPRVSGEAALQPDDYVDWQRVVPAGPWTLTVGINADYLLQLAKALGSERVVLKFTDAVSAIRVEPEEQGEGFAVLMPWKAEGR